MDKDLLSSTFIYKIGVWNDLHTEPMSSNFWFVYYFHVVSGEILVVKLWARILG